MIDPRQAECQASELEVSRRWRRYAVMLLEMMALAAFFIVLFLWVG